MSDAERLLAEAVPDWYCPCPVIRPEPGIVRNPGVPKLLYAIVHEPDCPVYLASLQETEPSNV